MIKKYFKIALSHLGNRNLVLTFNSLNLIYLFIYLT